jgi:predicted DNA-binding transcriptional regulator AlpA
MEQSASVDAKRGEYGTEPQIAKYLGLARITAQTRRLKGKDWPKAYRFGRRVMYRWSEVETWAASHAIGGSK